MKVNLYGYVWFPKSTKKRNFFKKENDFLMFGFTIRNMKNRELNIIKISKKINIF